MKWGILVSKSQDFPREIADPSRRLSKNYEHYKQYIERNIQNTNLYTTVYSYENYSNRSVDKGTAKIDKIYFDFDPDKEDENKHWKEVQNFHNKLMEMDIAHHIVFSGGGFHVYIHTEKQQFMNKNKAVHNAGMKFVEELGFETIDESVIGDLSQITRIPNTFNHKDHRQKWCIPLGKRHMDMSLEEIKEEAEDPNYNYEQFGSKRLDISSFDKDKYMYGERLQVEDYDIDMSDVELEDGEISIDGFKPPKCIARALKKGLAEEHVGHRERFLLITWFKDMQFSQEEIADILEEFLKGGKMRKDGFFETDYEHMINDTADQYGQISYIFERNYRFPSHDRLVAEGFCREEWGKCDKMAKPLKHVDI